MPYIHVGNFIWKIFGCKVDCFIHVKEYLRYLVNEFFTDGLYDLFKYILAVIVGLLPFKKMYSRMTSLFKKNHSGRVHLTQFTSNNCDRVMTIWELHRLHSYFKKRVADFKQPILNKLTELIPLSLYKAILNHRRHPAMRFYFKNNRTGGVISILFVMLIWGSAFTVTKLAVNEVPPLLFALLRNIVACLVLLPFYLVRRKKMKPPLAQLPYKKIF